MQVHGPSEITARVGVRLNPGGNSQPPFGVLAIGSVEVFVYALEEARKLALAAAQLERLLEGAAEGDAK